MARRRTNILSDEENLSKETPEVQNELLDELLNPEENVENEDKPGSNEKEEMNNLSNEEEKETGFKPGDKVKLNKNVSFDIMGRKIHNGIKNYNYNILSVRVDGMLIIECLTHCFTVKPADVYKI